MIPDEFLSQVKRKEKHLQTFADVVDIKLLSQAVNDVFKGNETAAFDCLFPGPKFTVERDSEQSPVVAFSIKKYWFEDDVCNPFVEAINTLVEDRKAVVIDDEVLCPIFIIYRQNLCFFVTYLESYMLSSDI